eukprot:COSAG01_NODE_158_length_23708_cov_7.921979_2_plen_53_part_00
MMNGNWGKHRSRADLPNRRKTHWCDRRMTEISHMISQSAQLHPQPHTCSHHR